MKLLQDFCQIFCCCSKLKEKTYGYLFEKLQPVSVQFNMLASVLHIYFYIRPQRNYCANTKYQQIVLLCRTLEHYLFKQKKSLKEQCNSKIRPFVPFVIPKGVITTISFTNARPNSWPALFTFEKRGLCLTLLLNMYRQNKNVLKKLAIKSIQYNCAATDLDENLQAVSFIHVQFFQ